MLAEHAFNGGGFHHVVQFGARAVGVDVAHIAVIDPRFCQRGLNGPGSAAAFGVRLGHGVGVERTAPTGHFGINRCIPGLGSFVLLEHENGCTFTDDEAVAEPVERSRPLLGARSPLLAERAQRGVGEQHERVDAAIGTAARA